MRLLPSSCLLALVALGCGASASGIGAGGGATTTGTSAFSTTSGTSTITTTGFTTSTGTGAGGTTSSSSGALGGSTSTSTSTSSSSSGQGTGGGPAIVHGDCHQASDCPGGQCVPVTPGGFLVCQYPPTKAITCNSTLDQCCPAMQHYCPDNAACLAGPLVPVCSGTPQQPHNQCGVDQCTKDVDCAPGQICALAGTLGLGIRACVNARCKTDADCAAHPGGYCAPVKDPCCDATAGLFCVYPQDGGCRKNADCAAQHYCSPDPTSGAASCQAGAPICPA